MLVVILLTNRIHPDADNDRISSRATAISQPGGGQRRVHDMKGLGRLSPTRLFATGLPLGLA